MYNVFLKLECCQYSLVFLRMRTALMLALSVSSKLQSVLLQQQSFLQKCESWMDFLSQTEQKLGAEISGNYQSLLEQQRDHEVRESLCVHAYVVVLIKCSFFIHTCALAAVPGRDVQQAADSLFHHQWWASFVGPGTSGWKVNSSKNFEGYTFSASYIYFTYASICELLTSYSDSYRRSSDDFSMNLVLLSNQWQCVVRRAQQRRGIIDSLVRQWQNYQEMAEKLRRWLQEVTRDPDVHQPGESVALQQARNLLGQIQVSFSNIPDLL